MKRLFKILANAGPNTTNKPVYFEKKKTAKDYRNGWNTQEGAKQVAVKRGPDHWRGETK